jgi:hypothetical protein
MTQQRAIDSAKDLCQKLDRTFDRRSAYGEDQLDWVFDVAVTTWHLVDWVARERNPNAQITSQQFKKILKATQDQFKSKCLELAVCEQICNGVKHLVFDNPQLKPFDVTTGVRVTDDLAGISKTNLVPGFAPGDENVAIVMTPAVWITDKNGNPWQAIDLFLKVLFF